jgi:hypothetical protein
MGDFAGAMCDKPNETTFREASQELGRKIVPERANPLGRSSNFQVEDREDSTRTEAVAENNHERTRVKNRDGRRCLADEDQGGAVP